MNLEQRRQKILIVDDNRQNIEVLMDLFQSEYKIAAAINGERALKIAQSDSPPDLILLDILMPDMSGYELCARLKENEATRGIAVVFVTAVSEVMDEAKGFAQGAVDYITKPFHPPMVKARVKVHLDLKRKQELLEASAFLDPLTEIPNRRRFDEIMDKEWHRALRSNQELSLIYMDVDHFKSYNDTYGHGRGDECLRRVARAIQESLRRAGDFVARWGGEEFAAVLPYTGAAEALQVAGQIKASVDALAIEHEGSDVAPIVTLSMGVATVRPCVEAAEKDLLDAADKALYAAKAQGRNRIQTVEISAS
ncbi:MAG: diguanylate cyclase [Desulfovibrionaceae bacterium]|nr:diguanylate cyclase [Desulfovibrionaceae bacterium]